MSLAISTCSDLLIFFITFFAESAEYHRAQRKEKEKLTELINVAGRFVYAHFFWIFKTQYISYILRQMDVVGWKKILKWGKGVCVSVCVHVCVCAMVRPANKPVAEKQLEEKQGI